MVARYDRQGVVVLGKEGVQAGFMGGCLPSQFEKRTFFASDVIPTQTESHYREFCGMQPGSFRRQRGRHGCWFAISF